MAPKARLPDQARVRLPYFQSLGQQTQKTSAASRKCVTYHSNLRRVTHEMLRDAASFAARSNTIARHFAACLIVTFQHVLP